MAQITICRIQNNTVKQVAVVDETNTSMFDHNWITCPPETEEGWGYDNGLFIEPPCEESEPISILEEIDQLRAMVEELTLSILNDEGDA